MSSYFTGDFMRFREFLNCFCVISNFINEDDSQHIYKIKTDYYLKPKDIETLLNCVKELALLDSARSTHFVVKQRNPEYFEMRKRKNIFIKVMIQDKTEAKNFLFRLNPNNIEKVICDKNRSIGGEGKVYIIFIDKENSEKLGYETDKGMYLKLQFQDKKSRLGSKVGLDDDDNDGYIDINTLRIKVTFISFHNQMK